ncbi:RDD family protein [bacterium]|nr:RDD family protein [bacterium]
MGSYTPAQRRRTKRSILDTLQDAENEHLLECPNADLPMRTAGLFLDLILISLATSAVHQLVETFRSTFPVLLGKWVDPESSNFVFLFLFVSWSAKVCLAYFYFIWTTHRFGGTPAKLLLGIRVVDARTGERPSILWTFLREGLAKPLGLTLLASPVCAAIRKDHRALHDLATRTVVKRVRGGPP